MTMNMHARLTADGKQAQAEIGKTAQAASHLGDEIEDVGRKAPRANQATSAFAGGGLRQMSMQFSQVAQQGAVTGNYIQALAIQAPDLALGFGTLGIAAGAAIPIVFSLAQGLLDVGDSAEDAQESVDTFLEALSVVQDYTETARSSVKDLRREFGDFARDVQKASELAAQAAVSLAFDEFEDAAGGIRGELDEVIGAINDLARAQSNLFDLQDRVKQGAASLDDIEMARRGIALLEEDAAKLLTALGMTASEAVQLDRAFRELARADGMSEVAEAAGSALTILREMYGETERIPPEVARIIKNLTSMLSAASAGLQAMEGIKGAAAGAADEAARLASNILVAANNAIAFQQAMASLSFPFQDAMEELDFELATAGMDAADKLVATRVRRLEETMRAASERTFGFDYGLTDEQKAQLSDYEAALRNAAPKLTTNPSRASGAAAKTIERQRIAVRDLIADKQLELDLLRETDPVQREMIQLRAQLVGVTDAERDKVERLVTTIQAEELAKAQAAETSEFFRTSMSDLIPDLVRGGDDAANAWQRFGRALEDAAWQALLLGEGPLMGVLNMLTGIGGGGGGGVLGWIGGLLGFAEGGEHGMRYGRGGPKSDKMLVKVSAGEFTVNAEQTQKHRALLEAINSGAPLPAFAAGGAHGAGSFGPAPAEVSFNLIDQTNRGIRISREERTGSDGSRQPVFVASDMVDEAMNLRGGKARRNLRRKGLRDPMVRT
ncbi:hypothetical protein KUW09_24620 [Mameliella alba]|nr:hypothetical protein [Antarctobacter heliothermus]MBY6147256.1 hypothetical protein [Mameliella alba]MCA0957294.1 hypothetical protein [Mameliella alba]